MNLPYAEDVGHYRNEQGGTMRDEEIQDLRRQLDRISKRLDEAEQRPTCRLCGSRLHRSIYSLICQQEFGLCGETWITSQGKKSFYHATSYDHDGITLKPTIHLYEAVFNVFFVAGEIVPREQYLGEDK